MDTEKVERLARELYVAWAPSNKAEHWDDPRSYIDRDRFMSLAWAAILFLDTYTEDDFMRHFDFDDHFADVITE